jgi:hypothetical protein
MIPRLYTLYRRAARPHPGADGVVCRRVGERIRWMTKPEKAVGEYWECGYLRALLDVPGAPDCVVFSSNDVGNEAIANVLRAAPHSVLIHLSDERTNAGKVLCPERSRAFADVYSHALHVFRQYAMHPEHVGSSVSFIPLGFMTGMFDRFPCHVGNHRRELRWSFAGNTAKMDRPEMIAEMRAITPHRAETKLSPKEVGEMYADSHFVPIGRGNANHDCFRIYEASLAGAIPVVVISEDEKERTFGPMQRLAGDLPWLFGRTWREAAERVKSMPQADATARGRECHGWITRALRTTQQEFRRVGVEQRRLRARSPLAAAHPTRIG